MIDNNQLLKLIKKKKLEDFEEEIKKELETTIKNTLKDKIKQIKNKKRIIVNDNAKEHLPATEVFTKKDIKNLPQWVQDDINNAKIIGSSQKVIKISNGKKYHINNKLNDLSGGEWTFFLNSVITKTSTPSSVSIYIRRNKSALSLSTVKTTSI